MGLFNVSKKVICITGGRRGIGKALTLGFVKAGCNVVVIAKSHEADELKEECSTLFGSDILYISSDLLNREERKNLIDRIIDHYGKIDVLINNAGTQLLNSINNYTFDQWDKELELMVTCPFDLSKQASKYMINQRWGRIINIGSISSYQGARNVIGYSTVKHALNGVTKCLAVELAEHNITCNQINPGFILTDMLKEMKDKNPNSGDIEKRIPSHRMGLAQEIVGTAIMLSSEAGDYINGTFINIDGGWSAR